ncbi:hypothetical protein ARMA_0847 [Ardenticatena maritima]|uniref:Uncharacterized protein n=1 Tax=Ardenticatena maritima TaxID=872965 RepID=A0A0M9UC07_9CHLR|nr:hypothetical protein [Ardenticatena maritima]KPL88267.1 hypothetical protein SE16_05340 [Ardenticatena maritima]GAP62424.1 hypothetical protein ARMA_0847 [Ardenticatena maritima]
MDSHRSAELRRQIAEARRCRQCGSTYAQEHVYVLGCREALWAIALKCSACGAQAILFLNEPPPYTHELTPAEEQTFFNMPPIGRRDLYTIQSALNAVEDDISSLWQ